MTHTPQNILTAQHIPPSLSPDYLYLFLFSQEPAAIRLHDKQIPIGLHTGDLLLFPGSLPLTFGVGTEVYCTACRLDHINEAIGQLLLEQNPISRFLVQTLNAYHYEDYLGVHVENDPALLFLFQKLLRETKEKADFYQIMQSHLFSLLMTDLIRRHSTHCFRDIAAPFSDEGYRIMSEIIHSDFKLTLKDIAVSHHIAPAYASRYVKKTTGVAFSKIMASARDYVARLMLSTTPKSICAIAEQVGYENPENFVRAFKKLHGCTPGEYRRKR